MRILYCIYLLSLALSAAFAISTRVDQRISNVIAENVLHFGHNVGLKLSALDPHASRSEIFSPLSLMTALSQLTLGAKGKSYQELRHLVGLDSDSELLQNPNKFHEEFGLLLNDLQHKNLNRGDTNSRPNANWRSTNLRTTPPSRNNFKTPVEHIIKVANGLFVQNDYSLNLDYSQVLKYIYESEFTRLDYVNRNNEARDFINAWVNKATFGKIPKIIIDDIDKDTKIILASALYFKAFWENQFIAEATTEDDFYPDGEHNPSIKVQMMPTGGIFPFYDAKEYDCRIIGLPYRDNETTMYVIQPNNSTRQKLRDLQRLLDAQKINNMIDNMERKRTIMVFPKMHFTRSLNLKEILQSMNVNDIFVNGASDLSLIGEKSENRPPVVENNPVGFFSIFKNKPVYESLQTASNHLQDGASLALSNLEYSRQKVNSYKPDLYVDDVIHNVDFAVDEQGTEAAAVTHITLVKSGPEVIFRATTPFLIVIRHDPTKLPLFYGIINRPEL